MSSTWTEKERIIPLGDIQVEGIEGGMVDDLKFRPNKYFHPIEDVRVEGERCVLLYQRQLSPVEGKVSLAQVRHVIRGVIDGQHKLAESQILYLYPGVEAFGLDRRKNLRVGLINARPHNDWERSEQELCVDAFSKLIAEHCPEGQKRIVAYRQKILTLRHLLQVLEGYYRRSMWSSFAILLLLLAGLAGVLYQWGPPRIKATMQKGVYATIDWGRRMVRSSTVQWDHALRDERRRWEYRHGPVPVYLILNPKTKNPQERALIHYHLMRVMEKEFDRTSKAHFQLYIHQPNQFPVSYRKSIPSPSESPKLMEEWRTNCFFMYGKGCPAHSWLLRLTNYRGGFRPLVDAVRAALKKSKRGGVVMKYQKVVGSVTLGWVPPPRPRPVASQKAPAKKRVAVPPRHAPGARR